MDLVDPHVDYVDPHVEYVDPHVEYVDPHVESVGSYVDLVLSYKFGLSVCLGVWVLLFAHGLSGHFRIQRRVTRTSPAIRTGCQDHRVHSRVIRTKKRLSGPFCFVSAQKTQSKPTHL